MPTRIMFHNLKQAEARHVGDSSWIDLTDADKNVVTVFLPRWIANDVAACFSKRLEAQEDIERQAIVAAQENARYSSHGGGLYQPRHNSIKDNDYDS